MICWATHRREGGRYVLMPNGQAPTITARMYQFSGQRFDKSAHHRGRIGGGQTLEGFNLVLTGVATGEVGQAPKSNEGNLVDVSDVSNRCAFHVDHVGTEGFSGIVAKRTVVDEGLARDAVAADGHSGSTAEAFSIRGAVVQLHAVCHRSGKSDQLGVDGKPVARLWIFRSPGNLHRLREDHAEIVVLRMLDVMRQHIAGPAVPSEHSLQIFAPLSWHYDVADPEIGIQSTRDSRENDSVDRKMVEHELRRHGGIDHADTA